MKTLFLSLFAFLSLLTLSISLKAQAPVIEWQKCFGSSSNAERAYSITQTQDGGSVVAGYRTSINGRPDFWIIKLDSSGNITWQKYLGGSYYDYAYSITQTQDGGFLVAGSTSSTDGDVSGNHGQVDVWVVKLDPVGNLVWQKCFGSSSDDVAKCITQTQDGGYILAGYNGNNNGDVIGNHGSFDYWIVKLDPIGEYYLAENVGRKF
jgi:hypothetical protein